MSNFGEQYDSAVIAVFEWCDTNVSTGNVSKSDLEMAVSRVVPAMRANAIISSMVENGLLRQTRYDPVEFVLTENFFSKFDGIAREEKAEENTQSFANFSLQLIVALYKRDETEGPRYYDLKETADQFGIEYRPGWVRRAAFRYKDEGLINDGFTLGGGEDGNLEAEITAEGLERAEEIIKLNLKIVENLVQSPPESRDETNWIPTANRYVTIKHNSQYAQSLETLDSAIRQFKEDQRFDNELGPEKTALIKALEGGRQLLNDTRIWLATAISTIVQPLKRIASKYKEAAIQGGVGAVVTLALQQVASLLGLL